VLKQVICDTHANVQVKVKRTRMVEANYNAHTNLRIGLGKTSLRRELDRKDNTNKGKLN
jgi:hypothetical protein